MNTAVIGLGAMGTALAHALLHSGHRVTAFNRTTEKIRALMSDGVIAAATVAEAAAQSDIIIVCVTDYRAAKRLVEQKDAARVLGGRILLNLSTGTPAEARAMAEWASTRGIRYLDGAIDAYPQHVGTAEAVIRIAGNRAAFDESLPALESLTPNVSFFSENPAAVCALDCALLTILIGRTWGYLHASALAKSEGISAEQLIAANLETLEQDADMLRQAAKRLDAGDYIDTDASVLVHRDVMARIVTASENAGLDTHLARAMLNFLESAMREGWGELDVAALRRLIEKKATE